MQHEDIKHLPGNPIRSNLSLQLLNLTIPPFTNCRQSTTCTRTPHTALASASDRNKRPQFLQKELQSQDQKDLTGEHKSAQQEFNPRSSQQASKFPPLCQSKSQDSPPNHELTSGHCQTRGIQPTATDNTCGAHLLSCTGAQLPPCSDPLTSQSDKCLYCYSWRRHSLVPRRTPETPPTGHCVFDACADTREGLLQL